MKTLRLSSSGWLTSWIRTPLCCWLLLAVLHLPLVVVNGHPGGVANGRATCGTEYSTPESAYTIPDVTEAWYLRRIATCESPVFWTTFEVVAENQPLYVAVISPALERFADQLDFHGILYGPGVTGEDDSSNGLFPVPVESLPPGITLASELGGAGYLTSPPAFDSCDFVDTNPVMEQFSDLSEEGRCIEEFTLSSTFEDPLQQSTTSYSWWLYSFNHVAAQPGTYYLQTWLTDRTDPSQTVQGKYEITLGPWTWSGYASDTTLQQAQDQGTTCACAVNALDYKENYRERLGTLNASYHVAALPGGQCGNRTFNVTDVLLSSPCTTTPEAPYVSDREAVEWSGVFALAANRTYEWTFHAYYQGTPNGFNNDYGYPDPGMMVVVVPLTNDNNTDDLSSLAVEADTILSQVLAQEMEVPLRVVGADEILDTSDDRLAQFIEFTDTGTANSTTVLLQPESEGSWAFFTQHVPSEFMAHMMRDADSGDYVFPTRTTLYVDNSNTSSEVESATSTTEPEENGDKAATDVTETGSKSTASPAGATKFHWITVLAGTAIWMDFLVKSMV